MFHEHTIQTKVHKNVNVTATSFRILPNCETTYAYFFSGQLYLLSWMLYSFSIRTNTCLFIYLSFYVNSKSSSSLTLPTCKANA